MDYRRQLSANSRPYYANNRQMSRQFSRQLSKNFNREKTEYFPTANLKVNVNLKLHERLVYQLIDRSNGEQNFRTIKEYKDALNLPRYELNNVNFSAYMPEDCYNEDSLIKMKFFLKEKNADAFHPVSVEYDINIQQQVNSDNQLFYHVESNVKVPLTNDQPKAIELFYFYFMEHSSGARAEFDLISNYQIRIYNSENATKEHFDGVLAFGESANLRTERKSLALKSFLKIVKSNELNNGLTSQCLIRMQNVYKCLCIHDKDYKRLFDLYIDQYAKQFFRAITAPQMQSNSWHNNTLLAIFYCAYEFDVQQFQSMEFMNYLFGLYRPLNTHEFTDCWSTFKDDQKRCLSSTLPKYLRKLADESYGTLSGISAYIVLYYLEKIAMSNMLSYRLPSLDRIDLNDLVKLLRQYQPLFQEDSTLAALFLSYIPLKVDHLKEFISEKIVKFDAIIMFMTTFMEDKRPDKKLAQDFIALINFLSSDELIEKQIDDYVRSFILLNHVNKLLEFTTKCESKNSDLITKLTTYILKLSIHLQKYLNLTVSTATLTMGQASGVGARMDMSDNDKKQQFEEVKSFFKGKFLNTISMWMRRECHESLLINYGLDERDLGLMQLHYEQEECLREVHETRMWILHDTKTRIDSDMKARFNRILRHFKRPDEEMFHLPQDNSHASIDMWLSKIEHYVLKTKVVLGTNDEAGLYLALLDIGKNSQISKPQLPRAFSASTRDAEARSLFQEFSNHLYEQFWERISDRCSKDFKELIQFRSRFGFEQRFREHHKFKDLVDSRIAERLSSKNRPSDLELLCEHLRGNPSLLQFYTDNLLRTKFPTESMLELHRLLTWEPYLTLMELKVKAGHDAVLSTKWSEKYDASFRYLATSVCSVIEANVALCIVKLLNNNILVVGNTQLKHLSLLQDHLDKAIR